MYPFNDSYSVSLWSLFHTGFFTLDLPLFLQFTLETGQKSKYETSNSGFTLKRRRHREKRQDPTRNKSDKLVT